MLKYVSKFTLDILPSLLATVIGAYIVNHYIVAKPDAPAAAAVSTAEPKADVKAPETPADVANVPEPGVRAKGISEKSIIEKSAAEKPAVEKPAEKSADKPAETASIPAETKRHQPAPREKTAKTVAPPVQPSVPVVAAPVAAPPAEAATPAEEHRDANDLARAAIERLRGLTDSSPHPQEAARPAEAPRVVSAPAVETPRVVSAPPVRPLPPPIMVSNPAGEALDPAAAGSSPQKPPYAADAARIGDPRRPTPPADIPASQPLDLRAEAMEPPAREHRNVAEDVLSAAKSVFHAVLPK
jgi:hypothetical protein